MSIAILSDARGRLEWIVLRCDLVCEEAADDGDLLQDVSLYSWHTVEEENGEDTSGGTETGSHWSSGRGISRRFSSDASIEHTSCESSRYHIDQASHVLVSRW